MKGECNRNGGERNEEKPFPGRRDCLHREIAGCLSAVAIFESSSCHLQLAISRALFCGALLFHLAGSWLLPLVDRDEPRFAEASREMIERGDYVVPYFNDHYRFDKPPLTYWARWRAIASLARTNSRRAFPSAVAAALSGSCIFAWGRRLESRSRGLVGGDHFHALSSNFHARRKRRTPTCGWCFFVTLAHWAGYELRRDRSAGPGAAPSFRRTKNGALVVDCFIFRSHLAFSPKGRSAGCRWAQSRSCNFSGRSHIWRDVSFSLGEFFSCSRLVALWGVPAMHSHAWRIFRHRDRATCRRPVLWRDGRAWREVAPPGDRGAAVLFLTVFLSFAPWSVKLPWLIRRLWRKWDSLDLYLVAGT